MNAALTICGQPMCWGIRPEWMTATIHDVPAGGQVVRRRFRARQVGVAFVKIGAEIRKYYLNLKPDGGLKLGTISAINRKEP